MEPRAALAKPRLPWVGLFAGRWPSQAKGDEAMRQASLQACCTVLDAMQRRGLHLDPLMAQGE